MNAHTNLLNVINDAVREIEGAHYRNMNNILDGKTLNTNEFSNCVSTQTEIINRAVKAFEINGETITEQESKLISTYNDLVTKHTAALNNELTCYTDVLFSNTAK